MPTVNINKLNRWHAPVVPFPVAAEEEGLRGGGKKGGGWGGGVRLAKGRVSIEAGEKKVSPKKRRECLGLDKELIADGDGWTELLFADNFSFSSLSPDITDCLFRSWQTFISFRERKLSFYIYSSILTYIISVCKMLGISLSCA